MFDVFYWGPKPNLFVFEEAADSLEQAASQSRTLFFWYIYGGNDYSGFDFTRPMVPWEYTHVYTYGSQWQRDAGVYLAHRDHASSRAYNFRTDQRVRRLPDATHWYIPKHIDADTVDVSWHPDPHEPDYEYHFASQHQSSSGVIYRSSQGLPIKFSSDFQVRSLPRSENWQIPDGVNASSIDLSWHPNTLDPAYVYHFQDSDGTVMELAYQAPGATEIKILDDLPVLGDQPVRRAYEIFFLDYGNALSEERYQSLSERYEQVTRVRFANTIWDTVRRCANRSTTSKFWIASSRNDYTDFDFNWQPEVWQRYMSHVFGSQHQDWSDTFLLNRGEIQRAAQWARSIEELPNLNFVTNQRVRVLHDDIMILYVDHGNADGARVLENLKTRYKDIKVTRFATTYFSSIERYVTVSNASHVWVVSSICDYEHFDFTWQPSVYQQDMLHVFATDKQPFGDTFYLSVSEFCRQCQQGITRLDQYGGINYTTAQPVPRLPIPVIEYESDNLPEVIKQHQFQAPYTIFTNTGQVPDAQPNYWENNTRVVETFTRSGGVAAVPRVAAAYINTQVYDYPYISKVRRDFMQEQGLDIVFLSNGEPEAERWYQHTCEVTKTHVKRVENVPGRKAAYQAAAALSETDWFFAVFAKLEVDAAFDWQWQPDRLQAPKHYIFNARNPVNGLCYGHMGMIAYNRNLVLSHEGSGLDFTLDQAHESVPLLSGTAHFNADPWTTWRTAFREVIKLKHFMVTSPTVETEYRLDTWCTRGEGANAEWSLRGARDAVDYYDEVGGDLELLRKSYEWQWLRERFVTIDPAH